MRANSTNLNVSPQSLCNTLEKDVFHILLADDDKEMRRLLSQMLHAAGFAVTECIDGMDLLEHLESFLFPEEQNQHRFDLIISDIRMPGITGMEILEGVQMNRGFPPMILITAFGDEETHLQAKKFKAAAMFDKPFDIDDLLDKVRQLLF
ncbi:response regulator [Desulfocicer niacini]